MSNYNYPDSIANDYFDTGMLIDEDDDYFEVLKEDTGLRCQSCYGTGLDRYEDVDCLNCWGEGFLYESV
jgi:hypothetical protein